jgi:hypothetical protein
MNPPLGLPQAHGWLLSRRADFARRSPKAKIASPIATNPLINAHQKARPSVVLFDALAAPGPSGLGFSPPDTQHFLLRVGG